MLRNQSHVRAGEIVKKAASVVTVSGVAILMAAAPAFAQTVYYGSLAAYEGDEQVAKSSGGWTWINSSDGPGMHMRFKDTRADGDGAYSKGYFQAWDLTCPPNYPTCYYTWTWSREKETARYGTAEDWVIKEYGTYEPGIDRWRDRTWVCVDQNLEPDACDGTGFMYPFG